MPTTLCFDFGNTRKKCAVFIDGNFTKELVLEDDTPGTIKDLIEAYHPDRSIRPWSTG